ncbi:MAG: hypothetical protein AAF907_15305, partial [Planctomycetota bacterium]
HPLAVVGMLAATAASLGVAIGWSLRGLAAQAADGRLPILFTPLRMRGLAAVAAFGIAALAAFVLIDEVRTRWNEQELGRLAEENPLRFLSVRPLGPTLAQELVVQQRRYDDGLKALNRPDSYLRGVAEKAGIDMPKRLTSQIYLGLPLSAGLLGTLIAWRVSGRSRERQTQAPTVGDARLESHGRSLRSGLNGHTGGLQ